MLRLAFQSQSQDINSVASLYLDDLCQTSGNVLDPPEVVIRKQADESRRVFRQAKYVEFEINFDGSHF